MAEEKKSDAKDVGAIGAVAIVVLVIGFLIRYCIPITLGLILSILLYHSVCRLKPAQKIKNLLIILGNYTAIIYLFTGLPWNNGNKNQFKGILGEWGTEYASNLVLDWNRYWYISNSFFTKKATIHHFTWLNVSELIWDGLIAAVFFFAVFEGFRIYFDKNKKENQFVHKLKIQDPRSEVSQTLFKIVSFPLYPLIRFALFKPAHDGHKFALSLNTSHPSFVEMILEGLLFSVLLVPYIFVSGDSSGHFNDFIYTATGVGTLPFLTFVSAFLIGLIPGMGEHINRIIFESPHSALPKNEILPGFVVGVTSQDSIYRLTEKNINHHIQVVAPSGGGKTNILKNLIHDRISKGHGIIFLDYKAEFEVAEFIYKAAESYGRADDVRIFSLTNREISVPYNPMSHGSAAELQSRLMNAFSWSTEVYYKSKAESVLLKTFRALTEWRDLGKNTITLKTVFDVLTKKGYARELATEIRDLGGENHVPLEEVAAILDRPSDVKELQGLITNLEKVIYSGAGELLTVDAGENSYTVQEAIDDGRITYFLMNSLSSKETAASIGKLLLQDLMGYVGRAYDKDKSKRTPITIIIDEFAEFAIPEFPSFLSRVRGAGIGVVIAHQSRGDLKSVSDDYMLKIEANTSTKIVAGVTDPDDAQFYSNMIGTRKTKKETIQTAEEGIFWITDRATGVKSVREVDEFIIHPNPIKQIEQGVALVISRTVDTKFGIVRIPRSHDFKEVNLTRDQIEKKMSETRGHYLVNVKPGLKTEIIDHQQKQKTPKKMWE